MSAATAAYAEDLGFRRAFNLSEDLALIRDLHAAAANRAAGVDQMFGVPLTTAEADEIRRRDAAIEDHAPAVKEVLRQRGQKEPDAVMDHEGGGVLRVRSAAGTESDVTAALAARGIPKGAVIVEPTDRTLDELKSYQVALRKRWRDIPGISSVGIDHDRQMLQIGLTADVARGRSLIASIVKDSAAYEISIVSPAQPQGSTAQDPYPYHGGYMFTNRYEGLSCTLGIPAYRTGGYY